MQRLTEKYSDGTPFIPNRVLQNEGMETVAKKLSDYEDKVEQGLIIELDSKDELIETLARLVLNSEFGRCYMCTNPIKNVTLDGKNNGCDGGCNNDKATTDDLLKKIVTELNWKRNIL